MGCVVKVIHSAQGHERQNRQQQDAFTMFDLFRGWAEENRCEHRATPGLRLRHLTVSTAVPSAEPVSLQLR
jgi:hypothetical protein